ncbi:MAG: CCA tRNA nucleotidyltransferase [Deltaproteobacteria bacterium]|nr:CCA tRNA nucleotidyltransferase [Deltaproteobacteria bacterium]
MMPPSLLRALRQASESPCHLVGGAVRDALLGRPVHDWDVITSGDAGELARRFAQSLNGTWFELDAERGYSRVCLAQGSVDFAPWRAATLEEDLRARDFTINALAFPLHERGKVRPVDPLGGLADLRRRVLRCCSEDAFVDDPLRILRGVRLALQFQLEVEPETLRLMRQQVPLLRQCAGERIVAELEKILGQEKNPLALLRDSGCCGYLFGSLPKGFTLPDIPEKMRALEELARESLAVFRLAALTRADCGGVWRQLPWSGRMRRLLADLVTTPAELPERYKKLHCSERGKALWLERLGRNFRERMLFAALLSNTEAVSLAEAFANYEHCAVSGRVPPFVPAEVVGRLTELSGPELGKALRALEQAEIDGLLDSQREAWEWLSAFGKGIDSGPGYDYILSRMRE